MRAPPQPEFVDFYLPFGDKLRADNRWVKLGEFAPWDLVEERYGSALAGAGMGAPALPGRVAFGSLVLKERLGIPDEETVEQVFENPYLQHFHRRDLRPRRHHLPHRPEALERRAGEARGRH